MVRIRHSGVLLIRILPRTNISWISVMKSVRTCPTYCISRKEKQELRGGTPLPPYSRPITYLFRVIDPTNYNYGYHSFVVNDDTMTCVVSGTGYRASAPCTPPQPIVSTISISNFDHRTFDFFRIRMEKNITAGKILQKSVKNAKSRKIGTTRNSEKSGSV